VPRVIALTADLLFASRIRAEAERAGTAVELARSPVELLERVGAASGGRVLLDLEARGLDIAATVAALRAAGAEIVAFVSHVRGDLIETARAAGAQRVLARSAFVRELPGLLARDAPETEAE
jgi:CheY-like chemotaxis protein